MANWASVARLGDPSSADWQRDNLTTLEPVPGQRWQVHRNAAKSFEGLFNDLKAAGYPLTSSGGFNYRNIRGGNRLSQHAFGTAIDINAASNPMLRPGQAVVTDLPSNIAELAARHNLEWGGNWKRPDAMHFEWRGDGSAAPAAQPGAGIVAAVTQPAPGGSPQPAPAQPVTLADALGPMPGGQPMVMPDTGFSDLAKLFTANNEARQKQRERQEADERARRTALFSGPRAFG